VIGPGVHATARLRVLVVEEELALHGGQERSYLDVSRGLAARGHEIHLAHRTGGDAEGEWQRVISGSERIGTTMVHPPGALHSLVQLVASSRRVAASRPDVVYVNQYQDTPLGALVAAQTGGALVCHLRQPVPRRYGLQWTAALPRVDRFIAVSHHTREQFIATGVPADRIDIVPLGIDTEYFVPNGATRASIRAEHGWDTEPVVLFAGRLDREKGLEVLLAAWRVVTARAPKARLVIAGSPRNHPSPAAGAAYATDLQRHGGPGITWLTRRLDVAPLYAAADVVVLPSVYAEPSGRTILEGMATGLPVVASHIGGIPEHFGELTDLLVPPGDAEALAAGLLRVLEWRADRPALGQQCRENALRFTVARTVDGAERVLVAAARREPRGRVSRRDLWGWGRAR
jgi:glycosyltransferase involved in cell wall biosynthesis